MNMKMIAAIFAGIALLATLPGFWLTVLPVIAQLGKIAVVIAAAGFAVTAVAYVIDELIPEVAFDAADIHP